jgi:two-component system cell cycle response regulator DivK
MQTQTEPAATRPLVLVVEADSSTREMYAAWLSQSGFTVAEAAGADEALAKALTLKPAIVTTGIGLQEGTDGCVLCERLKHEAGTKEIPVVVVTAWVMGGHVERAHRAGCDAVLLKPCLPNTLLSEINRLLERM